MWGPDLYFSTSDNSDPRANGRIYLLRRGTKAAAADPTAAKWAGAPLERIMHHMLSTSTPRHDFVPGRVVHVIGSLGPGGAERQALYTVAGLLRWTVFRERATVCLLSRAERKRTS